MANPPAGFRALIVDDNLVDRRVLMRLLAAHATVDCAANAAEAVTAIDAARLAGRPYALISLDIDLVTISGHLVLRHIRASETAGSGAAARVLMVSAHDEIAHVMQSFENLADGYLHKPVTAATLHGKLQEFGLMPPA
jgi:two-component system sensor histidine kinase/response regulator